MSQKSDLQANNVDLQSILNTINALPEAGAGGSLETVTLTFVEDGPVNCFERYFVYTPENGVPICSVDEYDSGQQLKIIKNSLIVTETTLYGNVQRIDTPFSVRIYVVLGDCYFICNL